MVNTQCHFWNRRWKAPTLAKIEFEFSTFRVLYLFVPLSKVNFAENVHIVLSSPYQTRSLLTSCVFWFVSFNATRHLCLRFLFKLQSVRILEPLLCLDLFSWKASSHLFSSFFVICWWQFWFSSYGLPCTISGWNMSVRLSLCSRQPISKMCILICLVQI